MTKETDLAKHMHSLKLIVKTAQEPKLLWEEMQILAPKAFKLQEKIEKLLTELEETATEVTAVQMLAETREMMWDLMTLLAERELQLKTLPHPTACQHSHHHCCCHHEDSEEHHHCCCHEEKKVKKCCKGKKKCQKK
jgi:hypothetical protein